MGLRGPLELVYRLETIDCLYVPDSESDGLLPNSTALRPVMCNGREVIVPYIPNWLVEKALDYTRDELKDVIVTSLFPPCDIVESLLRSKGIVELGDFLEYRDIRVIERILGMVVTCPAFIVKHGIVFEGRIIISNPCSCIDVVEGIARKLRRGIIIGGLREAGCGYLRLLSIEFVVEGRNISLEEVKRACFSA